jgi:hypothetical protein
LEVCCSGEEKCNRPVERAGLIRCDKCLGWYHEGECGDAYPFMCPVTMKETFLYMCELCATKKCNAKAESGGRKRKATEIETKKENK